MTGMRIGGLGLNDADVQALIAESTKRTDTYEVATDGSGNAVFVYDSDFSAVEFIGVELVSPASIRVGWRITASSLSGCTVNVQTSSVVSILGIDVLSGVLANVPGQQVRIVVVGA